MSSKGTLNKIRDLIKCSNYKRLGRCFESSRNKYFYDLGTGKVFQIEEEVKKILQLILCGDWKEAELCSENAIQEVYNAILEEEILQAPELKAYIGAQVYDLSSKLNNNRAQITLELTEKCNMRCKYCIYHDGNGGYRELICVQVGRRMLLQEEKMVVLNVVALAHQQSTVQVIQKKRCGQLEALET